MTPFAFRRVSRLLHLVAASLIGWSIYGESPFLDQLIAWAVFPALAATGLAMWFPPTLLRLVRRI
jgi:hypothetical protein